MNKILVPTDFSEVADNAITYAAEIAIRTNAILVLFHTYYVPMISTDVPVYVDFTVLEEIKKNATETLINKKAQLLEKFSGLSVHYILEEGDIGFMTEQVLNQNEYDLVVMGTTGAGAIQGLLVGSNTFDVINRSHIPVLAVPKNAIYNGIKKTAFGTNCRNDDFETISQFLDFAKLFDAQVSIVHIENNKENEDDLIEWFETEAKKKLHYPKLGFRMFLGKELFSDFNDYLEHHHYDLLALHKRTSGFFESIFKPSLTKKFVFHSNMAVLVYK
jgi:nucleotide-binding universal stress UspA family protein